MWFNKFFISKHARILSLRIPIVYVVKKQPDDSRPLRVALFCAPGMGDSLAVKVRYGLGSGNH
jgi:hypothetical protein